MGDHQPTQPLLSSIDAEQNRSTSMTVNWKQMENWSLADGSSKVTTVLVYRSSQTADRGDRGREGNLEGLIAILVLVGWGFGLLIYATYALNMQGRAFHPDARETYQLAGQTVGNTILSYA
jgi:hypothetical protein